MNKTKKPKRQVKIAKSNLQKFYEQNARYDKLKKEIALTPMAIEAPAIITKIKHELKFKTAKNKSNKQSFGEEKVEACLIKLKKSYRKEVTFTDLPLLRFDFYLPYDKICIEFDGIQHFQRVAEFDGHNLAGLYNRRNNDLKKNIFCKRKGLKLIRIMYTQIRQVDKILQKELLNFAG